MIQTLNKGYCKLGNCKPGVFMAFDELQESQHNLTEHGLHDNCKFNHCDRCGICIVKQMKLCDCCRTSDLKIGIQSHDKKIYFTGVHDPI